MIDREIVLLGGGLTLLVGFAFLASRVLRSFNHGFSIRLQLFFGIWATSLLATGVIGFWVIDRLQVRAAELTVSEGPTVQLLVQILKEFGPKITLLVALLGIGAAGSAFAFGRAVAEPLERLTRAAKRIADGYRQGALPQPAGREVRALTTAVASMRTALEERHQMEAFVADLSHELKNPVAAIKAASEVLREGADEEPTLRHRFLKRIEEANGRMEGLIRELLSLASLEAGGARLNLQLLNLADAARDALTSYEEEASRCDILLDAHLSDVRVRGDHRWLTQAIANLIGNALRYSAAQTTVRIRLESVDDRAVLCVIDEGPGIDAAIAARIFERFVTDRKTPDQTGLGLAIVRSVTELHGGTAEVTRSDSTGTMMSIYLPKA